jgi:hypothetical protein
MILIFDRPALDRLVNPANNHKRFVKFHYDPFGSIPTFIETSLEGPSPMINVGTSKDLTLNFIVKPEFSESFGPGGFVLWGREDPKEYFHIGVPATRYKPCTSLGLVVYEFERPTMTHTLLLSQEAGDTWRLGLTKRKDRLFPYLDIVASCVTFLEPAITLKIQLAVKDHSGKVHYFCSNLSIPASIS